VPLFLAFLLAGCGSFTSSVKNVDWAARESTASYTEPMVLHPAYEAFHLRVPLLAPAPSTQTNEQKPSTQAADMAPLGVSLGNGVSVDARGYLFLDVLKLLRIDMNSPFSVSCRSTELVNNLTTLERKDGKLLLSSPFAGKGEVVLTDDGFVMKTTEGQDRMKIVKEGEALKYVTSILFDQGFELRSSDDGTLTVKELRFFGRTTEIRDNGGTISIDPSLTTEAPAYQIRKNGDVYFIESSQGTVRASYRLYFTGAMIYLVQQGSIISRIEIGDSFIRVNGKETVSYRKG